MRATQNQLVGRVWPRCHLLYNPVLNHFNSKTQGCGVVLFDDEYQKTALQ
jgi:hypothetical protein